MSNSKPLVVGGIAALVLVAGWAGASVMTQRTLDARIRAGIAIQDPKIPVRFANLQQRSSFRHAAGEVDVLMHVQCAGPGIPDTPVGHLKYEISQGLNPFGAQQVHWQFDVSPKDPSAPPDPAAPVALTVTGDGSVDSRGNSDQKIVLAPNEKLVPKDKLHIDPIDVSVRVEGSGANASFLLPALHAVDPKGETIDLKGLSGKFETPDGNRYNASYVVGLDDIVSREFNIHGVRVEGRSKIDKDVMSAHGSYRVTSGKVSGKDLKDLVLEVSFDGLPIADVERITRAADARCDAGQAPGAKDTKEAMEAATHLLRHGFKVAIDKFAGTVGDGTLDGGAKIEVLPTPGNEPISTTRVLKASGHLRVSGKDLVPAAIEPMVQQHYVVADGDALKSEFDFSDGKLTLNGNPLDLPFVQLMQARIDAELAQLANGGSVGGAGGVAPGGAIAPTQ